MNKKKFLTAEQRAVLSKRARNSIDVVGTDSSGDTMYYELVYHPTTTSIKEFVLAYEAQVLNGIPTETWAKMHRLEGKRSDKEIYLAPGFKVRKLDKLEDCHSDNLFCYKVGGGQVTKEEIFQESLKHSEDLREADNSRRPGANISLRLDHYVTFNICGDTCFEEHQALVVECLYTGRAMVYRRIEHVEIQLVDKQKLWVVKDRVFRMQ